MKKVNMAKQPDVVCDKCKNDIFLPAVKMKRISEILSSNGRETIQPMQIFVCASCGHVNDEWLPKEDKDPTEPKSNIITDSNG